MTRDELGETLCAAKALLEGAGFVVAGPIELQRALRELAVALDARTIAGRDVGRLRDQLAEAEAELRVRNLDVNHAHARIEALARGAS